MMKVENMCKNLNCCTEKTYLLTFLFFSLSFSLKFFSFHERPVSLDGFLAP